jgi:hypothetical protein
MERNNRDSSKVSLEKGNFAIGRYPFGETAVPPLLCKKLYAIPVTVIVVKTEQLVKRSHIF